MKEHYEDIIYLPHHVSQKHPQMAMSERAAQFSPFAALSGYGDVLEETARLTDTRAELDECEKAELNRRLQVSAGQGIQVTITYYVPDRQKEGGVYTTVSGVIKSVDEYEGTVKMEDGGKIPMEDIYGIDSEKFDWNF